MRNIWKGLIAFSVVAIIGGGYKLSQSIKSCIEICRYHDKKFTPAHTNTWTTMQCMYYDPKSHLCTVSIPIQHSEFVPDSYLIEYYDKNMSSHWEAVSKNFYDNPPEVTTHSHYRWLVCQ